MDILTATDFSPESRRATKVAARLAQRLGDRLVVAHVMKREAQRAEVEQALSAAASDLRALGGDVIGRIVPRRADDRPHDAIVALGDELDARLLVLGSHGRGAASRLILGSVAERTVLASARPTTIVRGVGEGFEGWALGHRPPRILAAVDPDSVEPLVAMLSAWRERTACDVTFLHLYWPVEEVRRRNIQRKTPVDSEVECARIVEADLAARIGTLSGAGAQALHLRTYLGGAPEFIILEADRVEADIIVVGSRRREGTESFWEGSTAIGVLRAARVPVVCVPLGARSS